MRPIRPLQENKNAFERKTLRRILDHGEGRIHYNNELYKIFINQIPYRY